MNEIELETEDKRIVRLKYICAREIERRIEINKLLKKENDKKLPSKILNCYNHIRMEQSNNVEMIIMTVMICLFSMKPTYGAISFDCYFC